MIIINALGRIEEEEKVEARPVTLYKIPQVASDIEEELVEL